MEEAINYLKERDKVLAKIIPQIELKQRKSHKRYFESLCISIINQQLSTKAAATIVERFVKLFPKVKFPKPEQVLKIKDSKLRTAGLSFQKISYIKSLAGLVFKGEVHFNKFSKMSDEDIIIELVKVKGIGKWTAEMFLMFCLNRPDVFSEGDLGLRNAVKKWYKFDIKEKPNKLKKLVKIWQPYQTTASRILWASLNLK